MRLIILILLPFYLLSQKDTLHVKYSVQLTGFYNKGNNNNLFVNDNNTFLLENSKIKNSTIYNYAYGQQTDVVNQNEHFFNNMFSHKLSKKISTVALIELEQSFMRSIHLRYVGGLGFSWNISKVISLSNIFSLDETHYSDGSVLYIERSSLRLKINYEYKKFTFKTETYVQPDVKLSYFRFRSNTSLGYKVSKSISFIISAQDSYEQYVLKGRVNNDFNLNFGLSISNF